MMLRCTNIEKPMDLYSNSFLFLLFAVFIKDAVWKAQAPDTPSQSQIGGEARSRRLNYTGENRNSSSANAAWTERKSTSRRRKAVDRISSVPDDGTQTKATDVRVEGRCLSREIFSPDCPFQYL